MLAIQIGVRKGPHGSLNTEHLFGRLENYSRIVFDLFIPDSYESIEIGGRGREERGMGEGGGGNMTSWPKIQVFMTL